MSFDERLSEVTIHSEIPCVHFLNHLKSSDKIINLFLYQLQYLSAIRTMSQHNFHSWTTAVITKMSGIACGYGRASKCYKAGVLQM